MVGPAPYSPPMGDRLLWTTCQEFVMSRCHLLPHSRIGQIKAPELVRELAHKEGETHDQHQVWLEGPSRSKLASRV